MGNIALVEWLSEWLMSFAGSPWGVLFLGLNSATEAIFNPIPVDPLLFAMGILKPELAIWYGAVCTICSVGGAVVGWYVGRRVGRPLIRRVASESRFDRVERLFDRYGAGAILVACVTPIPYKVFALAAGVLGFSVYRFVLLSLLGRGIRFMSIGLLIYLFGEAIVLVIKERLVMLSVLTGIVILGMFVMVVWARSHRSKV
ncbi:MAG: VTT domain-containing protein [Chloroflexota bacterium]|nr:VTT domain-containing protein [Chloroflexota bacterium]